MISVDTFVFIRTTGQLCNQNSGAANQRTLTYNAVRIYAFNHLCARRAHRKVTITLPPSHFPSFFSFSRVHLQQQDALNLQTQNNKSLERKSKAKRAGFSAIGRAANQRPLTGAVPLLRDTGTLACWVSPLGRCVPP